MNKKFSNALVNETSPYLLQHAHNPVNWYPWGEEALNISKEKDLPILISIGYSACHWCHVMERESFEDAVVAAYMNEHFVNIKIDREERPDLDHIYMDALQAMTGSGGWPLNVFLTTDKKPFYGGTYFPPVKAFNRSSWMETLHAITNLWQQRRNDVETQADTLITHIRTSNNFSRPVNILNEEEQASFFNTAVCTQMAEAILKSADTINGGFGKAPRFLQTFSIQYLLGYAHFFDDTKAREQALFTLEKMLSGGIYDQLAGGISRYSTDDEWLVPHFEKMLYDNALFASVLCDAFQLSKDGQFKKGIEKTLGFVLSEMKDSAGGYFTALDADSEGEEGKFYVWQKQEIDSLLDTNAHLFSDYYGVTEQGNWEGKNILNKQYSEKFIAEKYSLTDEEVARRIAAGELILLQARNKRVRPGTDDKILLNSNALLVTAFCKGFAATGDGQYKNAAIQLFEFMVIHFKNPVAGGLFFHTYKNGQAKYPAFLDDYAYLVQACIHLQEISSDQQYLVLAEQIAEFLLLHFSDEKGEYFYYTPKDQQDIVARKLELYDGATASANSIMAQNLFYLAAIFDNRAWHQRALNMLTGLREVYSKHPSSFAVWASLYLVQTAGIAEVAITGEELKEPLEKILREFLPNKVLQSSTKEENFPLLLKRSYEKHPTTYLCRNYHCEKPEGDISVVIGLLGKKLITKISHNNS